MSLVLPYNFFFILSWFVRTVTVLDYPKVVYHLSVSVVRHLFNVQMRGIERGHARVAVVVRSERWKVCPRTEVIVFLWTTRTARHLTE
jgi:hypothetical protein